jgi:hypothetical protein
VDTGRHLITEPDEHEIPARFFGTGISVHHKPETDHKMTKASFIPGTEQPHAWNFNPPDHVHEVFKNTLGKLLGVRYTLIASKEQAGSCRFLCAGTTVTPVPFTNLYLAEVELDAEKTAKLLALTQTGPAADGLADGWQSWYVGTSSRAQDIISNLSFPGELPEVLASTSKTADNATHCLLFAQHSVANPQLANVTRVIARQDSRGKTQIVQIDTVV